MVVADQLVQIYFDDTYFSKTGPGLLNDDGIYCPDVDFFPALKWCSYWVQLAQVHSSNQIAHLEEYFPMIL